MCKLVYFISVYLVHILSAVPKTNVGQVDKGYFLQLVENLPVYLGQCNMHLFKSAACFYFLGVSYGLALKSSPRSNDTSKKKDPHCIISYCLAAQCIWNQ